MSNLPKAPACKGGARITNSGRPASEALLPMAACCADNRGAFRVWKEAFTSLAGHFTGSLADWCWTGELHEIPGAFLPQILLMGQVPQGPRAHCCQVQCHQSCPQGSSLRSSRCQQEEAGQQRGHSPQREGVQLAGKWPTWDSHPSMEAGVESRSPLYTKP